MSSNILDKFNLLDYSLEDFLDEDDVLNELKNSKLQKQLTSLYFLLYFKFTY
jgi:hypothetical protein